MFGVPQRVYYYYLISILAMTIAQANDSVDFPILVYGASGAGVAAAITASKNSTIAVALVEPLQIVGGMLSAGGLFLNDQLDSSFNSFFVSGLSRELMENVNAHYSSKSDVVLPDMWVAQAAIESMLESRPSIKIMTGCALISASRSDATVTSITVDCADGMHVITSSVFIDASYSGDLLVASGVSYTFGREANTTYGESLAGALDFSDGEDEFKLNSTRAIDSNGNLLPNIDHNPLPLPGGADDRMMAFQHRACVTKDTGLKVPFYQPEGYNRSDHALLQEMLDQYQKNGKSFIEAPTLSTFASLIPFSGAVANAGRHKLQLCCGGWPLNSDAVTLNEGYVGKGSTAETRRQIDAKHTRYLLGALYYLANDLAVPNATRADASQYGLCGDEWVSSVPPHWPPQLYIREGARLVNDNVLTQKTLIESRVKSDGISVGAWYLDKHVVTRVSSGGWAKNEGHFRASTSWTGRGDLWCNERADQCRNVTNEFYDIPISALLPRRSEAVNLIVPTGLAASSVAYTSTRIESMFMATGSAAGVLASLANEKGLAVQDVPVADVQNVLQSLGQRIHGPPEK